MQSYKNILCAIDFSPNSDAAVDRAAALAKNAAAQLTLLHVVEFFPEDRSNQEIAPEDVDPEEFSRKLAHEGLDRQADRIPGIEISRDVLVSEHSAKYEIVRYAQEREIDLIVLSSHGHHGIRALLGSNADGVFHTARCDVLAVRAG